MELIPGKFSFDSLVKPQLSGELLGMNPVLESRGLRLTPADAEDILQARQRALKAQGRVEKDISVTKKLIEKLSESPYCTSNNFVELVSDLYEIFHYIKNHSSDFIPDDNIISEMTGCFDTWCGGSAELLKGKGADRIINRLNKCEDDEDGSEEEEYWFGEE